MKRLCFFIKKNGSTISVLVSLAALCVAVCRCEPIQMDWVGVLVGILSAIVAFLVGWNIYTALNIDKKVDDLAKQLSSTMEQTNILLKADREDYDHELSGCLYHIYAISYLIQNQYRNALTCIKLGIKEQNLCGNPVYLNNLLKLFQEQFKHFEITNGEISEILELLNTTQCLHIETENIKTSILTELSNLKTK